MKNVPPPPEGWNKTISDLMDEAKSGTRKTIGSPELDWARDYERNLLPPGTRFPCKGDIYEAVEDVEVSYLTSWASPYTGGGATTLRMGDRVSIPGAPRDPRPISIYAEAVDYKALEARVVPEADRRAAKYTGFYFSISTSALNKSFRLVSEGMA